MEFNKKFIIIMIAILVVFIIAIVVYYYLNGKKENFQVPEDPMNEYIRQNMDPNEFRKINKYTYIADFGA